MNRFEWPALAFLLIALPCCSSSAPFDSCGVDEPFLDIGSAPVDGSTFLPVEEGQPVELIHGPQGGFHVWLQLRTRNLCPEHLTMGWHELPAARSAILCPASKNVVGVPILLTVKVIDSADRVGAAQLTVVPACPAGTDEATCKKVCDPFGG
jgi:hypothetical protein